MIGSGSIICRRDDIPTVDLDGEIAALNPDKGKYYGFNSIASRVWELIVEPIAFEKIISILKDEYNVDEQTCINDVRTLLDKLYEEDLIIVK